MPIPCPLAPAVFAPVGEGCSVCPCPCPAPCVCTGCPLCSTQTHEDVEYVVEMKMVKAGDDEDQVTACPRVSVQENQTATVQVSGVDTPKDRCSLHVQATVNRSWNQDVFLHLTVAEACSHTSGDSGLHAHTETTETRCPIKLGKTMKMELTHDSNGVCTSWVVATVTAVETETPIMKTAAGPHPVSKISEEEEDPEGYGLSNVVEFIQDCFDLGAETAYSLSGSQSYSDAVAPASVEYLQNPPQACQEPITMCPASSGRCCTTPGTCTQCVAVEPAKQTALHVSIDASHDRKCVEVNDGGRSCKATADHVVLKDGCIELDGNVCASRSTIPAARRSSRPLT